MRIISTILMVLSIPTLANTADMPTSEPTSQPIGHYEFCKLHSDECQPIKLESRVILTEKTMALIEAVNTEVNKSIKAKSDQEGYGQDELWTYPQDFGDCEDYALAKRKLLLESGIAPSNLLMTVVRKPDGEGHAILTIKTNNGDLVLDNLSYQVKNWRKTNYKFLKRQSDRHYGRWVSIVDDTNVEVVSTVN